MVHRKKFSTFVLILSILLILAGCSSEDFYETNSKEQVNTNPQTPENIPGEKVPEDKLQVYEPMKIKLALTGDFLIHSNVWQAASTPGGFDFYRLIAPVAPIIRKADLSICHLETPLAPVGGPYESYPLFAAPPALLPAIKKAGYQGCTTASNHTVDQGFTGLKRTIELLDKAGLKHTGSQVSRKVPKMVFYEVNGLKIASLSFTYGTNGMPVAKP